VPIWRRRSVGDGSIPDSAGGPGVLPGLDVRGLNAEARQDGTDLLPVVVRVVERLRDEDPGVHLADPVVNNDHLFRRWRIFG
jgi:hypothetical protein